MNAELALAIECCRWSFVKNESDKLHEAAEKVNWHRFLQKIRRHRVQGLASDALSSLGVKVPIEHSGALSAEAAKIIEQNLRATRASVQMYDAFRAEGVPLLFVKGLTLAALAYSKPYLKMSSDVDILIHQNSVRAAAELLHKLEYRLILPRGIGLEAWHSKNKESVWRAPDGIHVELHTRLADNEQLIPAIGINSAQQEVQLPHGFHLPTLRLEELFTYLCVHGASSLWFRLKWITDLAGLLHRHCDYSIRALYAASQGQGAGRAPAQALLLADRLFNLLRNELELKHELVNDRNNRLLANAAWWEIKREHEPTDIPFGTLPIHFTQLLLLPSSSYKLGELRRQLSAVKAARQVG